MKRTGVRLAAIAAASVAIVMVAATVAFNLFIGWKVESDAVEAVEWMLDLNADYETEPLRTASTLELSADFQIDSQERRWSTAEERRLATWFAEHSDAGIVTRVAFNSWTCYAAIVPFNEYGEMIGIDVVARGGKEPSSVSADDGGISGYLLAYADVTSEQSLINTVNIAFLVIGIAGLAGASAAGYLAGRRIDKAQEAQKRFYENMSHELKTPLAAIRGYAEGAGDGVVSTAEATRAIEREADRMTATINEILGLSRLESGAVEARPETIVVGDFVQDCLMPLEGTVRTRGLDVDLELADGAVEADPNLFDHALSNVLSNAVRHADSHVRVTYDGMRLSVWNDGKTPEGEQLAHLFDRFYTGEGGSTGIGLAIAKEIATLHGWNVSACSRDGGLDVSFDFGLQRN